MIILSALISYRHLLSFCISLFQKSSDRLHSYVSSMEKVAQGDLTVHIDTKGHDEIGRISKSFQ